MTIEESYKYITDHLQTIYEEREASNITDWVFENIACIKRLQRITDKQKIIGTSTFEKLQITLKQLLQHKPVQYVLGEAWFYKMRLFVNEHVLIPRPETEELVEWICKEIKNKNSKIKILDIGTGSGCIAIALKKELPPAEIAAIDVSEKALSVAQKNAAKYQAMIEFIQLDFLDETEWQQLPRFNIIVSNPPYIPEKEKIKLGKNVLNYEPHKALFVPDNDPFIFYKKIVMFAQLHLIEQGKIYVEVHEEYAENVANLFLKQNFNSIIKKDIYGRDRMIRFSK